MFTGIVEEIGQVVSINKSSEGAVLEIGAKTILGDCHVGDSISVNGVCLTVKAFNSNSFSTDVMPETLRKSNLGMLSKGSKVNLERAMAANGRFGGHIVSGHIDGTGTVSKVQDEGNAVWVHIQAAPEILKLIVLKGSIAIDGISLTVAKLTQDSFAVSVIPHTAQETTLLSKTAGDKVNLENDIIGKYVARLTGVEESSQEKRDQLIMDFLRS